MAYKSLFANESETKKTTGYQPLFTGKEPIISPERRVILPFIPAEKRTPAELDYGVLARTPINKYRTPTRQERILGFGAGPISEKFIGDKNLEPFISGGTTIKQDIERKPKDMGILNKIGRTLLPKGAEEYFGLSQPEQTINKEIIQAENSIQSYWRQKRKEKNIAQVDMPTENYIPPTNFIGKLLESGKYGNYAKNVWSGFIKPAIGTVAEQTGIQIDNPKLKEWGENFTDMVLEEESRRSSSQSMADVPGLFGGGLKDPRFYPKIMSQAIGFFTAVFGTSVAVTAVTKNPMAGTIAGYGIGTALETSGAYRDMINEGVNPSDANIASQIYGTIATIIENATGIKPAGGLKRMAKDFAVDATKNTGIKKFFKTLFTEGIFEEGSQQLVQNIATKFVDKNKGIFDDVIESMVAGTIGALPLVSGGAIISNKNIQKRIQNMPFGMSIKSVGDIPENIKSTSGITTPPTVPIITPKKITPEEFVTDEGVKIAQKGFVKIPGKTENFSNEVVKTLKADDVKIMEDFLDVVGQGKKPEVKLETDARYLLEGVGINPDKTNKQVRDIFDDAMQRYGNVEREVLDKSLLNDSKLFQEAKKYPTAEEKENTGYKPLFLAEDKYSRPDNLDIEKISGQEAIEVSKKISKRLKLQTDDSQLLDTILDDKGKPAYAVSFGGVLFFTKEVPKYTGEHEAIHRIWDNLENIKIFSDFNKSELESEFKKIQKNGQDIKETISENYELYKQMSDKASPKTFSERIISFFKRFSEFIKRLFTGDNTLKIRKFYDAVNKRLAKEITIIPSGKSPTIKIENGKSVISFKGGDFLKNNEPIDEEEIKKNFDYNLNEYDKLSDEDKDSLAQWQQKQLDETQQDNLNFSDFEIEQGYNNFVSLLKMPKLFSKKELIESGDTERVKQILIDAGIYATKEDAGNALGFNNQQEYTDDEMLDMFKDRIMTENPSLLVGKKVSEQLGISGIKNIKSIKNSENIKALSQETKDKIIPFYRPSRRRISGYERPAVQRIQSLKKRGELGINTIYDAKRALGIETPLSQSSDEDLSKLGDFLEKLQPGDKLLTPKQREGIGEILAYMGKDPMLITQREVQLLLGEQDVMYGKITKYIDNNLFPTVDIKDGHPIIKRIVNRARHWLDLANDRVEDRDKTFSKLISDAEKSRSRLLAKGEKIKRFIVPMHDEIFRFLSGDTTVDLTKEEMAVAMYWKTFANKARQELNLEKYRKNYVTHLDQKLSEKIVKNGLLGAVKDIFNLRDKDSIPINIFLELDNIIGGQKFFKFALERKGGIKPTTNLRRIVHEYSNLYETKLALDKFLAEGQIAVKLLLKNKSAVWMKKYLQNLKGRGLDSGFRTGKMGWVSKLADSIVDLSYIKLLAFNVWSPLKNIVAGESNSLIYVSSEEQTFVKGFIDDFRKFLVGKKRMLSNPIKAYKLGRDNQILEGTFADYAQHGIGNLKKIQEIGMFGQRAGEVEIRTSLFLSGLTEEEWQSGNISEKRLNEMKDDVAITQGIFSKTETPLWMQTWYGRMFMQMNRWRVTNAMLFRRVAKGAYSEWKQGIRGGINTRRFVRMWLLYAMGMYLSAVLANAGSKKAKDIAKSMAEVINSLFTAIPDLMRIFTDNPTLSFFKELSFTYEEIMNYINFPGFEEPRKLEFNRGVEDTYIAAFGSKQKEKVKTPKGLPKPPSPPKPPKP